MSILLVFVEYIYWLPNSLKRNHHLENIIVERLHNVSSKAVAILSAH